MKHRARLMASGLRSAAPILLSLSMVSPPSTAGAPPQAAQSQASVAIHISGNRSFYWNDRKLRYLVVADDPGVGDSLHGTLPAGSTSVHFGHLASDEPLPAGFLAGGGLTADVPRALAIVGRENCLVCHTIPDSNASVVPSFTTIARSAADDAATRSKLAVIIAKGSDTLVGGIRMPAHPSLSEADIGCLVDFILTLRAADANPRLVPMSGELRLDGELQDPAGRKQALDRPRVYVLAAAYRRGNEAAPEPTASAVLRLRSPLFTADEASGSSATRSASVAGVGPVRVAQTAGAYLYFDRVDLTDVSIVEVTLARRGAGAAPNSGRIALRVDSNDGRTLGSQEIDAARSQGTRQRLAIPIEHIEGFHRLYVMLEPDSSARESRAAFETVEILPGAPARE